MKTTEINDTFYFGLHVSDALDFGVSKRLPCDILSIIRTRPENSTSFLRTRYCSNRLLTTMRSLLCANRLDFLWIVILMVVVQAYEAKAFIIIYNVTFSFAMFVLCCMKIAFTAYYLQFTDDTRRDETRDRGRKKGM